MLILSGASVFFLLPWASFTLHGMQLNYVSYENDLISQRLTEAGWAQL
jgi:hypothetical protein